MAVSSFVLRVSILGTCLLLLHVHSSVSQAIQTEAELCPVQVTEHFLTQVLYCFTGTLTLIPVHQAIGASICAMNLTYSVDSETEKPKVSFCATRDDISINSSFTNQKCQEITVEGTNSETRVKSVPMPFTNITSKIVMEVITQGIKASFTASLVEFFGAYEVIETASETHPRLSTHTNIDDTTTTDIMSHEESSRQSNSWLLIRILTVLFCTLLSFIALCTEEAQKKTVPAREQFTLFL